jgi:nucleotide-binding universal stress UspA family protein
VAVIEKILFPVVFSPSCVAMAPYVERAAAFFGARVSMVHVVDPASYNGFELYQRSADEVADEHRGIARERLDSFLVEELPPDQCERIVTFGDAATEIASLARIGEFDLIVMPTHAGFFRQMLLGSTTAKVLNDADCPVLTSRHAETIAPRPLDHREWLCAVDLSSESERVLRFAAEAAAVAKSKLSLIHAVQAGDPDMPVQLDLEEQAYADERRRARERIAELQRAVGLEVPVRIAVGSVKRALLEAVRLSDADALIIGRSARPGSYGRMRDLTYAVVRDSPFPVLSV